MAAKLNWRVIRDETMVRIDLFPPLVLGQIGVTMLPSLTPEQAAPVRAVLLNNALRRKAEPVAAEAAIDAAFAEALA